MRFKAVIAGLLIAAAQPGPGFAQGSAQVAVPDQAAFERGVAETKAAMMTKPAKALAGAQALVALAGHMPATPQARIDQATAQWLEAEAFIYLNQNDRAAPLIAQASRAIAQVAPGTKLQGDLMRSQGAIAASGGRVQDALQAFHRAHDIFLAAGEARGQALALQDIGEIYWEAGDYDRVLRYYQQSAEVFDKDPALRLTTHNNKGEVLRKLHRAREATREYRAALAEARRTGGGSLTLQILSNLAEAQAEAGDTAAANATVAQALALAGNRDAAGWRPFVYGVAARLAARRHDWATAGADLDRTFSGVDLTKTDMNYKEFHQLASNVYEQLGRTADALAQLKAFQRLDGDSRNLTASTSSQLLSARFDFANQKMRISQLKQAQLQGEVQLERQRSHFRIVVLGGALGAGGLVLTLLLVGLFSIRRSRNEVRAANVTLTEVNGKLGKALAAKTEFLATTSHEIRTPLNGILGMTQILLADRGLGGEVREKVEVVHGAGETMRALVDDILDLAKMETGKVTVIREPTELARVLGDTARLWNGHARNKGLELSLAIDGVPGTILSDEGRLRQIVSNLLSNAVKFTEAGRVELAARVEPSDGGDETLVIAVSDTGIGVPADQHAAIFEAFHQVDGGTTRQFSGTGLGLAIVVRLAAALGGTVSLESTPGTGSTFTLRMPLVRAEGVVAPVARSGARPTSLAGASVLVVQSNALTQGVMRALLEPAVGSVTTVADGDAALAALGGADHLLVEAASATIGHRGLPESLAELVLRATEAGVHSTVLFAPSEALPITALIGLGASQVVMKPVGGSALIAAMTELYRGPATPDALAA